MTALCIGNAKFFGGGMKIAPSADPSNGNLEVICCLHSYFFFFFILGTVLECKLKAHLVYQVVILQDFKWYDFVLKLHKLYNGSHLSEKNVYTRR